MPDISAIVITKNEARHIGACLAGLAWADEILVLDSFSTDATVDIARRFTPHVHQRPFQGFPRTRNAALDLAQGDWAFFLDADERTTPELAEEIRNRVRESASLSGYWVPRRNYILGRWMKHAGWSPDYQMRLFRRDRGRYDEARDPHEVVVLKGETGYLQNPIIHYNYEFVGQLFAKQNLYSTLQAHTLHAAGLRPRPRDFFARPLREFTRRYIEEQGYREGFHGLFLSLLLAGYELVTYAKLARIKS
ncbi:MAG: glycosyltransferase family 2 protein [Chloroflexi bacterium]|nr:glycosyltransferase family 2 protein [Chloroflexota bacterium]